MKNSYRYQISTKDLDLQYLKQKLDKKFNLQIKYNKIKITNLTKFQSSDQIQQIQSKNSVINHPALFNQNKDQEQVQKDKVNKLVLLDIIQKYQKLIDKFNKKNKQDMSVVLLIGVTGSGKSTTFNFLSGADFLFTHNKQLEIKNPQNHFSKMVGGLNSITKELNFYHNQTNNHLIIDFPGFQDTNGEQNQLLNELLFHTIITSGPTQVFYVVKNSESSLPNRGSDLQDLLNNYVQKEIQISKNSIYYQIVIWKIYLKIN